MKRLLDELPEPACLLDADGTVVAANDALGTLVGDESPAGDDLGALVADGDAAGELVRAAGREDGGPVSRRLAVPTPGGESVAVEVECSTLDGDDGLLCLFHDREADESPADEFESLLASFPLAVLTLRPDGSVETWNPVTEHVFGWTEGETIGQRPPFLTPQTEQVWGSVRERVYRGEVVTDVELRVRTVDNRLRHVTVSAAPITGDGVRASDVRVGLGSPTLPGDGEGGVGGDAGGPAVDGMLVVVRDVTEPKEQAQQLRLLDRVLRHNIRNDMNVVMGHADRLSDRVEDPELRDSVEAIVDRAADIIDLSNKARDFKEVVDAEYEIEHVDLVAVVEELVAGYREAHPGVTFAVDAPPEAEAEAIRPIRTAVDNLVENAVEHNDADEPRVDVAVDGTRVRGRDCVEVTVRDNGPTIPEAERKVFIEGQEDPLSHGSGLGLWLVYWIVRKSNGELLFSENEPRGSELTVRLERAREFPF